MAGEGDEMLSSCITKNLLVGLHADVDPRMMTSVSEQSILQLTIEFKCL